MQTEAEAVTVLLTEGGGRPRRRGEGSSTNTTNTTVMKKYSKLLLGLMAAVSSLCFIIYKYRYDRLYHVMQVLEVFGSPEDGVAVPGRSLSLSPGWVGLGGGVWLYSAYCSGLQCDRVSVLGLVQRPDNTAVAADLQCTLWFEGSRQPLQGLVSVATDDMRVSTFTCESKYPEKIPYAVAVYKGKAPKHRIQVQQSSKLEGSRSLINLCVVPASLQEEDISKILVDSLVFHSLVGVDGITLYSSGLPGSVIRTAEKLMKDTSVVMSVSTWSNPLEVNSSVIESLVSTDCYYRSKDRFENYAVINSQQVLIPINTDTVKEAFKDLTKTGSLKKGPNKLLVKRFCSEYPTEQRAKKLTVPISQLEYTKYNKPLSQDSRTIVSLVGDESGETGSQDVGDSLGLHEYRDCDNYDLKETDTVYEPSALRFFSELVKHYSKYA